MDFNKIEMRDNKFVGKECKKCGGVQRYVKGHCCVKCTRGRWQKKEFADESDTLESRRSIEDILESKKLNSDFGYMGEDDE